MADSTTALLDLPNELLRTIAQITDRDGLLGLSMTCRRLRPHGQEALVSTDVAVSPLNIWDLARTLRNRPELAKNFSHLRIGNLDSKVHRAIKTKLDKHLETVAYSSNYRDIVLHAYQTSVDVPRALAQEEVRGYLELALIVLFALSPNIKALSMGVRSWECMQLLSEVLVIDDIPNPAPLNGWHAKLKIYLQRLEKLEIIGEDFNDQMPDRKFVDVDWSKLLRLQRLAVPLSELFSFDPLEDDDSFRQLSLPECIHLIQIDVEWTQHWAAMAVVDHLIQSPNGLRKIEVRLANDLLSTAWEISKRGISHSRNERFLGGSLGTEQDWLRALKRWKGASPPIEIMFGTAKYEDTLEEMCHLAPEEGYKAGDLAAAIDRCVAMFSKDMKQHPELMEALWNDISSSERGVDSNTESTESTDESDDEGNDESGEEDDPGTTTPTIST
jgi:hypothetical protein